MPYKDKEQDKEHSCKYYSEHKEQFKIRAISWKKANPEKVKQSRIKEDKKLRFGVLSHYGNGKLACVVCGFSDIRALSIDHTNGDGREGKELGKPRRNAGKDFYRLLRRQDYPEGYQTLCMNCQFIKRAENKEYN